MTNLVFFFYKSHDRTNPKIHSQKHNVFSHVHMNNNSNTEMENEGKKKVTRDTERTKNNTDTFY
jgi:hypothetical protein